LMQGNVGVQTREQSRAAIGIAPETAAPQQITQVPDVSFGGGEDEPVRSSSLACRWPARADGAAAPGLVDGLQLAEQLAADRDRW
jgi:hypothetical protein